MGDGGVGQHALKIFLDDGHQVAQGHGDHGEDDQGDGEVIAGAVAQDRQAQQQGDRRGLGGGGDEGDDLVGASLVDVRGPEVEGEHGQFKEKARHGQQDADDADGAVDQLGHLGEDVDQVRGAGGAEDVAQAEEHEARGHGADEQILDARFHVDAVTPPQRHQDIQGVGRQLQGHIDGEKFHRAHQHHHTDGGGGEEEVEFRLVAFLDVRPGCGRWSRPGRGPEPGRT